MKPEEDPEWKKLWKECLAGARGKILVRYDADLLGSCSLILLRSEGAKQDPLIRELGTTALAADMALQAVETFLMHAEQLALSAQSHECVVKGQNVIGIKCHPTEQEIAAVMVAKEWVGRLFVELGKVGQRCKEPGWDPSYREICEKFAQQDFEREKERLLRQRARDQEKRDKVQALEARRVRREAR